MFDFTSMFAAETSSIVIVRKNYRLLQCLVGDSLLEPFWPTGSGCARGFLSSMDAAYAIKLWSNHRNSILAVLAQRESIYRLVISYYRQMLTWQKPTEEMFTQTIAPHRRKPTWIKSHMNKTSQGQKLTHTKVHMDESPLVIDKSPNKNTSCGILSLCFCLSGLFSL